ncbi:MAG: DEAD/DEAH box helicase, partial [Microcoleaceae cyanobacterium]
KEELGTVQEKLGIHSEEDLNALEELLTSYEKLYGRVKEAKRLLKTLYKQAEQEQHKKIGIALNQAEIGTIVSLKGKHIPTARRSNSPPVSASLVAKLPGSGKSFHWLCLGKDNRWYVVMSMDVVNVPNNLPKIRHIDLLNPPAEMVFKLGESRKGDELSQEIASQIPDVPELPEPPEINDQKNMTNAIDQQIEKHPIHKWGNPKLLIKSWNRMIELDQEINDRQTELAQELAHHWQQFTNLIAVLQAFSCLEESKPTVLGQGCAAIRGDNELWLGLALLSGYFDELDPHHLAAAAAALVTEISRPDSWTRYEVSQIVDDALGNLQSLRRQLFQVQKRHDVVLPVWLERDLIGLVEQWALGIEWSELITNTSL